MLRNYRCARHSPAVTRVGRVVGRFQFCGSFSGPRFRGESLKPCCCAKTRWLAGTTGESPLWQFVAGTGQATPSVRRTTRRSQVMKKQVHTIATKPTTLIQAPPSCRASPLSELCVRYARRHPRDMNAPSIGSQPPVAAHASPPQIAPKMTPKPNTGNEKMVVHKRCGPGLARRAQPPDKRDNARRCRVCRAATS